MFSSVCGLESGMIYYKEHRSDNATLSDIEFGRQVGRFRRYTVAISAAFGYDSSAMIRAEPVPFEPPRAPAWARPSGSFRENSEAEALFFAGAALSALDSVANPTRPGPASGAAASP